MERLPVSSTALALLLAAAIGCSGSDGELAGPSTLVVGPSGGDYASIQQAIDAATSGGTILVRPGVYTEWLDVSKSLVIVGSGPATVVEYPANGPADSAVITAHDVSGLRIESLSVRAAQPDVDGIRLRDATSVVLRGILAAGNTQDGLDVRRSSGIEIVTGTFEDNLGDGIQVDEGSNSVAIVSSRAARNGGDGVKITLSGGVLVQDSVATQNGDDGILVRDSNRVELRRNSSTANAGWGVSVNNSPDTVLDGNTVVGNGAGDLKCEPDPCSGG